MATGPVDAEVEAVYLLDFLTGDLGAMVLGKQPRTWTGFFKTNVAADLALDPQKNPKFLMVTGMAGLRRAGGSRQQPSSAVCYVAEITSGKIVAYAIPWSPPCMPPARCRPGRWWSWGCRPGSARPPPARRRIGRRDAKGQGQGQGKREGQPWESRSMANPAMSPRKPQLPACWTS